MLKAIAVERASRMDFMRNPDNSVMENFEKELSFASASTESISTAWQYAQSLDYHHPGQSKVEYLAHPVRVATLFAQLVKPFYEIGVIASLLHNIQELSNVQEFAISTAVGKDVASAISLLTVNRDLQWDDEYKQEYYRNISNASVFVQQVKVLDKLDNLFLLCLNPSDKIRNQYLREIEKWLLPLASNALPLITGYLIDLIEDNRVIGHLPLEH